MLAIDRIDLAPELSISRVVTGLWQIADMERGGRTLDVEAAARAMQPYIDAGFTSFDMADHYGSAELIAGWARPHEGEGGRHVQLFTKWVPPPGAVSADDARAAVVRSIERLRVPAIDLLQFHAWNYADPAWLDALFHLRDLQREGLIRYLGLTNVDAAHLRLALTSGIPIVSNQVSASLVDRRASGALAAVCQEFDVSLLAYGTLCGGWLSDRWLGAAEPDWERQGTWSQMKYGRFIRVAGGWPALQRVLRAAREVADRHGVSIANVATRFVMQQSGVAAVIVGARLGERSHIADNARLAGLALDEDDRLRLEAAIATLVPIPGDCGDEYRVPPFLTASGDLSHHLDAFPAPYEVRTGADGTRRCFSGTRWEPLAGYCRAVRRGARISVSGTTATHRSRVLGGVDPAAQTHAVIDKIAGAVQSLGGRLEDVVRTRIYVSSLDHWEAVARAHGERFRDIQPANTLVQARLVGPEYLVEIEAEAEVAGDAGE
jgi:aryl-alcohol dehydrogenase-like predicted oxidoreductase/enamine deaminase RidA (YjgF/YER057c/UK114 family)